MLVLGGCESQGPGLVLGNESGMWDHLMPHHQVSVCGAHGLQVPALAGERWPGLFLASGSGLPTVHRLGSAHVRGAWGAGPGLPGAPPPPMDRFQGSMGPLSILVNLGHSSSGVASVLCLRQDFLIDASSETQNGWRLCPQLNVIL